MITIDFNIAKDDTKYITITNSEDSKNKNILKIDIENPSEWNKQKINAFLIRTVSIAEEKLQEPTLSENAKKEIESKSNIAESIKFIYDLFCEFVKKYND